ncbi:MAG: hypothetical protein AAFR19_07685 [Pseudomonadota bacterium]
MGRQNALRNSIRAFCSRVEVILEFWPKAIEPEARQRGIPAVNVEPQHRITLPPVPSDTIGCVKNPRRNAFVPEDVGSQKAGQSGPHDTYMIVGLVHPDGPIKSGGAPRRTDHRFVEHSWERL